ncbi:MAG: hypothetical protein EOP84_07830 [Verrucomicrobiaceae bacterium]|nr:MAG: hypothetical protein EOP84_07830 [Verrucomicrobiaceae bacterium]
MDIQTIIFIVVVAVAGLISSIGFRKSPTAPLNIWACVLGTLSPLIVAAFGAFGFLASYELSAMDRLPWQIGYGLLAAVAVLIAGWVMARCRRRTRQ